MEDKELSFRLEMFEGPLDLLLHLIKKNKVSIYDIPIVEITGQYLEYLAKICRIAKAAIKRNALGAL